MALSEMLGSIMNTLMYGSILIAFAVAGVVLYWYSKFKYTCLIYEKRADSKSQFYMDKASFVKLKSGDWVFKLLKRKHTIKPPSNKFLWPLKNKIVVHLRALGADLYEPFNPDFPETKEDEFLMKLNYDETLSWNINIKDRLKTALDFKGLWEKYGLLIISMIAFVMTIVVIFLLLQYSQDVMAEATGTMRGQTNMITEALKNAIAGEGAPN